MIEAKYFQLLKDIENDKFEDLDMMHHLTSGMKSVFSDYTSNGLYVCRQSIGGAGYSAWSGLPYIIEEFSPTVTFEGDNTVMAQQGARYL
jgi:acyl-CoA oxidase